MDFNIPLLSSLNPVNALDSKAAHCISSPRNNFKAYEIEIKWHRLDHTKGLLPAQYENQISIKEKKFKTINFFKFFLSIGLVNAVLFSVSSLRYDYRLIVEKNYSHTEQKLQKFSDDFYVVFDFPLPRQLAWPIVDDLLRDSKGQRSS